MTAATETDWERNKQHLIDELLIQGAGSDPGVTPEMRRAYASYL